MNDTALPKIDSSSSASHWMSRMLNPGSIAIVGVSGKPASFGHKVLSLLRDNSYPGEVFLVNPGYDSIGDHRCYKNLSALPVCPDLVVMAVGNHRMESSVREGIDVGVGGFVIFANNYLEGDVEPLLLDRLKQMTRQAGIPVCGGNGMGFFNYDSGTLVSFDTPPERPAGHISLVAHSGSVMTYLANTDPRLMYNLVVSPGQEISGTVADYIHYALEQPTTRVIALFIETIRDPKHFRFALKKARQKEIPVVIVKVGATEKSARMAHSHSGAVAGSDTAFQALCDHYGAIRVADIDELAATALVLSQEWKPGPGKLSSLLDSGGLREQMIDLAEPRGVEFTELTEKSKEALGEVLEHGLVAENPVDAMGAINIDVAPIYEKCLRILNDDPGTAILSLEFEFRDGFSQYPKLLDVTRDSAKYRDKPLVVVNSTVNVSNSRDALELGKTGIPVVNGISLALAAIGNTFWYRDHVLHSPPVNDLDQETIDRWKLTLTGKDSLDEVESLELLQDFGLPVVDSRLASSVDEVMNAASLGYPLVLKSAQPGLLHKSDADGVRLGLDDEKQLGEAYTDLSSRLGPRVVVAPMVTGGVELGFGMVNDEQFGPMVMVCAGGIYIELLDDRRFIPAPCSPDEAMHHIQSLAIYRILKGARGKPACRADLAAQALSRFSQVAYALRDCVSEIDLNPVIVTADDCIIVDALVIPVPETTSAPVPAPPSSFP